MKKSKDYSNEIKWDKDEEKYVPKGAPLAYVMFVTERKEEYHKDQQNHPKDKKLSAKQITVKIRSEWKNMSDEGKQKYLSANEKERKRADMQKKEMEEKGFFTLTNGMKSSDIDPPSDNKPMMKKSMTPVKPANSKRPGKKKGKY
jgi:HMG-box domain